MEPSPVTFLDRSHLPETIEVLSSAFAEDPLMKYCFAHSQISFDKRLKEMFRFACEVRLMLDWPLLGCWNDRNQLVGVAGLSLPGNPKWPATLHQVYNNLKALVGQKSAEIIETYAKLADTNRPEQPHYQLGMIGVDASQQGNGYGRMLITKFHAMADADTKSLGIWLDTEKPENVPWYEQFGYQVKAESQLGDVTIYGMFRPKR